MLGITDHFVVSNTHYIVTKYEAGGDLCAYMKAQSQERLSESQALYIFTQMAVGLKDVHRENIVHRDIKHKNIFFNSISSTPKVKIADFGLACYLEDDECFIQEAGTVGYKAPEIVLKEPSDFKSDIWSLGCILYELLSGKMPFEGTSVEQIEHSILHKVLTYEEPIWQTVSPSSVDLLKNMLNRDQDARFDIADVITHPWVYQSFEANK